MPPGVRDEDELEDILSAPLFLAQFSVEDALPFDADIVCTSSVVHTIRSTSWENGPDRTLHAMDLKQSKQREGAFDYAARSTPDVLSWTCRGLAIAISAAGTPIAVQIPNILLPIGIAVRRRVGDAGDTPEAGKRLDEMVSLQIRPQLIQKLAAALVRGRGNRRAVQELYSTVDDVLPPHIILHNVDLALQATGANVGRPDAAFEVIDVIFFEAKNIAIHDLLAQVLERGLCRTWDQDARNLDLPWTFEPVLSPLLGRADVLEAKQQRFERAREMDGSFEEARNATRNFHTPRANIHRSFFALINMGPMPYITWARAAREGRSRPERFGLAYGDHVQLRGRIRPALKRRTLLAHELIVDGPRSLEPVDDSTTMVNPPLSVQGLDLEVLSVKSREEFQGIVGAGHALRFPIANRHPIVSAAVVQGFLKPDGAYADVESIVYTTDVISGTQRRCNALVAAAANPDVLRLCLAEEAVIMSASDNTFTSPLEIPLMTVHTVEMDAEDTERVTIVVGRGTRARLALIKPPLDHALGSRGGTLQDAAHMALDDLLERLRTVQQTFTLAVVASGLYADATPVTAAGLVATPRRQNGILRNCLAQLHDDTLAILASAEAMENAWRDLVPSRVGHIARLREAFFPGGNTPSPQQRLVALLRLFITAKETLQVQEHHLARAAQLVSSPVPPLQQDVRRMESAVARLRAQLEAAFDALQKRVGAAADTMAAVSGDPYVQLLHTHLARARPSSAGGVTATSRRDAVRDLAHALADIPLRLPSALAAALQRTFPSLIAGLPAAELGYIGLSQPDTELSHPVYASVRQDCISHGLLLPRQSRVVHCRDSLDLTRRLTFDRRCFQQPVCLSGHNLEGFDLPSLVRYARGQRTCASCGERIADILQNVVTESATGAPHAKRRCHGPAHNRSQHNGMCPRCNGPLGWAGDDLPPELFLGVVIGQRISFKHDDKSKDSAMFRDGQVHPYVALFGERCGGEQSQLFAAHWTFGDHTIVIDTMRCEKAYTDQEKREGMGLNALCQRILGFGKSGLGGSQVTRAHYEMPGGHEAINAYCVSDAALVLLLISSKNLLPSVLSMANECNVTPYVCSQSQMQNTKATMLQAMIGLLTDYLPSSALVPDAENVMRGTGRGGLVHKPKEVLDAKGRRIFCFDDPILLLDFNSLYPNIAISHNVCTSTFCTADTARELRRRVGSDDAVDVHQIELLYPKDDHPMRRSRMPNAEPYYVRRFDAPHAKKKTAASASADELVPMQHTLYVNRTKQGFLPVTFELLIKRRKTYRKRLAAALDQLKAVAVEPPAADGAPPSICDVCHGVLMDDEPLFVHADLPRACHRACLVEWRERGLLYPTLLTPYDDQHWDEPGEVQLVRARRAGLQLSNGTEKRDRDLRLMERTLISALSVSLDTMQKSVKEVTNGMYGLLLLSSSLRYSPTLGAFICHIGRESNRECTRLLEQSPRYRTWINLLARLLEATVLGGRKEQWRRDAGWLRRALLATLAPLALASPCVAESLTSLMPHVQADPWPAEEPAAGATDEERDRQRTVRARVALRRALQRACPPGTVAPAVLVQRDEVLEDGCDVDSVAGPTGDNSLAERAAAVAALLSALHQDVYALQPRADCGVLDTIYGDTDSVFVRLNPEITPSPLMLAEHRQGRHGLAVAFGWLVSIMLRDEPYFCDTTLVLENEAFIFRALFAENISKRYICLMRAPDEWDSSRVKEKIMGFEIRKSNCAPLFREHIKRIYDHIIYAPEGATGDSIAQAIMDIIVEVFAQAAHAASLPPIGLPGGVVSADVCPDEGADPRYRDLTQLVCMSKLGQSNSGMALQNAMARGGVTVDQLQKTMYITRAGHVLPSKPRGGRAAGLGTVEQVVDAAQLAAAKEQLAYGTGVNLGVTRVRCIPTLRITAPGDNGVQTLYFKPPRLRLGKEKDGRRKIDVEYRDTAASTCKYTLRFFEASVEEAAHGEAVPRACYLKMLSPFMNMALAAASFVMPSERVFAAAQALERLLGEAVHPNVQRREGGFRVLHLEECRQKISAAVARQQSVRRQAKITDMLKVSS